MAQLAEHGGICCGIRHIHSMDHTTIAQFDGLMRQLAAHQNVGGPRAGRLIEVVLSERQASGHGNSGWADDVRAAGGWPAVLQARGFRLTSRFENANSGRKCYIFHFVPTFLSIRPQDLPFQWDHQRGAVNLEGREAPAAAPAARVTDVATISTFHNVLQAGRSDAGYSTWAAARAKAPRARRIDRKDVVVRSNGTTRTNWIEGVNG